MNRVNIENEIQNNKKSGISNPWLFIVTLVLCTIASNSDWGDNRLVWWGCVALFTVVWLFTSKMIFTMDVKYTVWMVGFFAICALSFFWAQSTQYVTETLKSLVVHLLVFLMLRSSVHSVKDIKKLLVIIALSSVVNSLYLLITNYEMLTSPEFGEIGTRLGTDEGWNANSVGMMAAVAALIFIYILKRSDKLVIKFLSLIVVASMIVVSLLSGSRKAFIMVLFGIAIYLMLVSQKKKIRTIIFVVGFVIFLYYLVMENPYFYSIIGWRMEGFWALISGDGTVDSSSKSRQLLISVAIDTWKKYPILGCGLNCFRIFGAVVTGKELYAHNNYAELLADLGIIGTAFYYGGYVFIVKNFVAKLFGSDNLQKLLFTLIGIIVVIEFACVTYIDFLFQYLIMVMFAYISINSKGVEEK